MSLELLEMECSFNTLLTAMREKQGHAMMRGQMDNLRDQQQHITILKQVAMQPQNQPRPVSAPSAATIPIPLYPRRLPCDMGSKNQVQAENANALHKNSSDSETRDRLQDILEEPPCRRSFQDQCYLSQGNNCDNLTGVIFKILAPLSHLRAVCTYVI